MTVKEIVKDWLVKNGYDGIYYPFCNKKCSCFINSELWWCGEAAQCKPGYIRYKKEQIMTAEIIPPKPKSNRNAQDANKEQDAELP